MTTIGTSSGTTDIRTLQESELAVVNGGLALATYPVKAISLFGMTAYVSNGELVAVRLSDGTIKKA